MGHLAQYVCTQKLGKHEVDEGTNKQMNPGLYRQVYVNLTESLYKFLDCKPLSFHAEGYERFFSLIKTFKKTASFL